MGTRRSRKGTSRNEDRKKEQSKNLAQPSAAQKAASSKLKKERKKQRNKKLTQPSPAQKKPPSKSKRERKQALQKASKPISVNPITPNATPSDGGYNGVPSAAVGEVFSLALEFRRMKPTADVIIRVTKTELDKEIVSSLIEAALRLLPPATTPQGIKEQQEISRRKRELSQKAEDEFLNNLRKKGFLFLTEKEQRNGKEAEEEKGEKKRKKKKKQQMSAPTPDVRFKTSVNISGHTCLWLEYKNFFGFRKNPFVARNNRKQLTRYTTEIGPGAVVYRLGYETGHLNIEGVRVFRESDLLERLQ
ncbi:hypothetical protein Plec18167_003299 [Paecilomyces lecythidis]|uniref:CDAN1-interacting nuclease 1 n=1 Tax=Paecilomyces lecythidis TaxID=3004212 RepID=A0ABR3Y155_9EURO